MRYTVKNAYTAIAASNHHIFERAVKSRDKQPGRGWDIIDNDTGHRVEPHLVPREGGGWNQVPVKG